MQPISLYIHFPWCIKKCPYCDFNSHAGKDFIPEDQYISALLQDLENDIEQFSINSPVQSIFLGGGTPSLFSPAALERLFIGIHHKTTVTANAEITLEANPGTFESQKFAEFRDIGINRLSIGIQSFNDKLLQKLGRIHSGQEALMAGEIAHQAGFENINLDLMFGLPGSSLSDSEQDVRTAISLDPKHISFYQLTLEPNTYFFKHPPILPSDDRIFTFQQNGQKYLQEAEYDQYEISAFAKTNFQCNHNLNYWQFGDYLGIGAGAHGKITTHRPKQIVRIIKPKHPELYLKDPIKREHRNVLVTELALEFLMNHLRLKTGFSTDEFITKTGLPFSSIETTLGKLIQQDLIIKNAQQYQCSEKGWNFLDDILAQFVPDN
jgi:oxygen-independent coproporphyrinogen-3 oxidase